MFKVLFYLFRYTGNKSHSIPSYFQNHTRTPEDHRPPGQSFLALRTIFRRVRKIVKSDYQLRRVCLSVSMQQLCSRWKDFHEILYFGIFRKYVDKIQVSLKSDKNNGPFTLRPIYILIISRSFLLRMRNVSYESCRENQNTHFWSIVFFFSKIVPFVR